MGYFMTAEPDPRSAVVLPDPAELPELPPWTAEMLALLRMVDASEELLWSIADGRWHFGLQCSDLFEWGSADAEDVTAETMAVLRQTVRDLTVVERECRRRDDDSAPLRDRMATHETADLFACRVRGQRPMRVWYKRHLKTEPGSEEHANSGVAALFDAAATWAERGGTAVAS